MKPLAERPLLLLLAAVQFTHIMDFMILMPLAPQLMRELNIGPGQFSALVAAYTVSSGAVGLVAAPFIDRFDRRLVLLVAYAGFTLGTFACALSPNAMALLTARAISGAFGGCSTAIIMAIIADVIPPERRAAGIGIVMTSFSLAAAFGVPFGLQLALHSRWAAPFIFLAAMAVFVWLIAFLRLPSLTAHLRNHTGLHSQAFRDLLRDANAGRALLFLTSLVIGHFAIIPLLASHLVADVGLPERHLFLVYLTGGALSVFTAPIVGKLADSYGRWRVLSVLVTVACVVTVLIAQSRPLPVWAVMFLGGCFFVFASGRFVPGQAIMTMAVPSSRRGAFMSLSGCARDLAMGFTSSVSGWIVTKQPSGQLLHFDWLGWGAVVMGFISLWLASRVKVNEIGAAEEAGTAPEWRRADALPINSQPSIEN